jgi:dGTPase
LEAQSAYIESDVGASNQDVERAFLQIASWVPLLTPYQGTKGEKALLRSFTSALINRYINSVSLIPGGVGEEALSLKHEHRLEVAILKRFTWHYVIDSQPLSTQRFGQRCLIRSLFNVYCKSALSSQDSAIFPPFYRELLEASDSRNERIRIAADIVSSMNEAQAIEMNQRLTGQSLGFALDRPLA